MYIFLENLVFFFHPLAFCFYKPMSQALQAAAEHFVAPGHAHLLSICPSPPAAKGRQAVPLPDTRVQAFLWGITIFWSVSLSTQALPVLLTNGSSLHGRSLEDLSVLWVIYPQTVRKDPLFKNSSTCPTEQGLFESFKLGILKLTDILRRNLTKINQHQKLNMKKQTLILKYFKMKLMGWRTARITTICLLTYPHCLHKLQHFQDMAPQRSGHRTRGDVNPQDENCFLGVLTCGAYQTAQYRDKPSHTHPAYSYRCAQLTRSS